MPVHIGAHIDNIGPKVFEQRNVLHESSNFCHVRFTTDRRRERRLSPATCTSSPRCLPAKSAPHHTYRDRCSTRRTLSECPCNGLDLVAAGTHPPIDSKLAFLSNRLNNATRLRIHFYAQERVLAESMPSPSDRCANGRFCPAQRAHFITERRNLLRVHHQVNGIRGPCRCRDRLLRRQHAVRAHPARVTPSVASSRGNSYDPGLHCARHAPTPAD